MRTPSNRNDVVAPGEDSVDKTLAKARGAAGDKSWGL